MPFLSLPPPVINTLLIAAAFVVLAALAKNGKKRKGSGVIKARKPLTEREQSMYFRLAAALPEHVVLSQVSFSALLTTKTRATRNRFDRKVADFVICRRSFSVLAVVELDDSTHKGRENEDSAREKLLTDAGYKVLRYRHIPDEAKIRADIANLFEAVKTAPAAAINATTLKEPTV